MKRYFAKAILMASLIVLPAVISSCAKEGCPANQALHNETTAGGPGKKSKKQKTQSGIIPSAKEHKKY